MIICPACCSSAGDHPNPTSGTGWQRWNAADVDLNSRRSSLRNFKYESYSKPEEVHFRLRIIWLLSIVSRPLQSGRRSNGRWTVTYFGAIDHWIFSDWFFRQWLNGYRWWLIVFSYWEDYLNINHSSPCHKFQWQLVLKFIDDTSVV